MELLSPTIDFITRTHRTVPCCLLSGWHRTEEIFVLFAIEHHKKIKGWNKFHSHKTVRIKRRACVRWDFIVQRKWSNSDFHVHRRTQSGKWFGVYFLCICTLPQTGKTLYRIELYSWHALVWIPFYLLCDSSFFPFYLFSIFHPHRHFSKYNTVLCELFPLDLLDPFQSIRFSLLFSHDLCKYFHALGNG